MKLTLDQLRVDSYATQASEQELTEIKGGTSLYCGILVVGLIVDALTDETCTTTTETEAGFDENGNPYVTTTTTTTCE